MSLTAPAYDRITGDQYHATERTPRWTPLAFCRSWAGAQQIAATIADTADLGTLGTAEHKYWKTLGQKLLAPCCSRQPATTAL